MAWLSAMGPPNCSRWSAVGEGRLVGALGDADTLGGDADAPAVEERHGDLEAFALLPQQAIGGELGVLVDKLGGFGGADAHLVLELADGEAGGVFGADEGGDVARGLWESRP